MADGLTGSLTQMGLGSVLRMLCASGQDGVIEFIDGMNRGEIFVAAGGVVHAEAGAGWGEDALVELLSWHDGMFHFKTGVRTPAATIHGPLDAVLTRCAQRSGEREQIRKAIPSSDIVLHLFEGLPEKPVTVQPDEWLLISSIDGARNIGDIAERLDWDDFAVTRAAYALIGLGLVSAAAETVSSESGTPAGANFFKTLTRAVAAAMGPLAEIIIDDAIEEMGETRETFPKVQVSWLAERISSEILDPGKRVRFQAIMLDELRLLHAA